MVDQNETAPTAETPISGYKKYPLQSLEKALEPVDQFIEDLVTYICTVKQSCENPKDGLTQDESASIMIYTTEMGETSLYRILNQALRSENRHGIKAWYPYLKLFTTALHKLPSFQGVVWRGVQASISKDYDKGQRGVWWSVSSVSSDGSIMQQFMSQSGERAVFTIECKNGKRIHNHSYFPQEDEVLLMPGFYYEVTTKFSPAPGMHIIGLKEIDTPW